MTDRPAQTLIPPWLRYMSVGLAALVVSIRCLDAGFVQWDDSLLTGKLAVHGLSAEHLRAIFLPSGMAWQPVRDLVFAITYAFSGNSPLGYHLVNISLYIISALLAYRVLEVLLRRGTGLTSRTTLAAWLGALIFALHPLHVEAFAWVQANKDLLAATFFLAAFLAWEKSGRSSGSRATWYYVTAFLAFLLALGSKPSAAAFPLVILAFDLLFRPAGRKESPGRLLARHLPYWLPTAALALYFIFFTSAFQRSAPGAGNLLTLPAILAACYRLTLLPLGLLHRYTDPGFRGPGDPAFWTGFLLTAAIVAFLVLRGRKYKLIAFGSLWFYLCWLPQSNLVPIAIRVADRYLFLSLLGAALIAGILLARLVENSRGVAAGLTIKVSVAALLAALGILSVVRAGDWRDGLTLWGGAVSQMPESNFLRRGLGNVYLEREELDKATDQYRQALELDPRDTRSLINLGYVCTTQGRQDDAEGYYSRVLDLDGKNFDALNGMGNVCAQRGQDSQAIDFYTRALQVEPDNYMAKVNLATLYRRMGRRDEADSLMAGLEQGPLPQPVVLLRRGREFIERGQLDSARTRFERALELDGGLLAARGRIGEALLRQDSLERALQYFRPLLTRTVPDWSLYYDIGLTWNRLGQNDSALVYYRAAWRLEPDSSASSLDYAVSLTRADSLDRAIEVASQLAEARPDEAPVHYNLGNWLAKAGRYPEAVSHYRQVLALDPDNDRAHLNLGLVYMQYLSRPDSALTHLEASLRLAPSQPQAATIRGAVEFLRSRGVGGAKNP